MSKRRWVVAAGLCLGAVLSACSQNPPQAAPEPPVSSSAPAVSSVAPAHGTVNPIAGATASPRAGTGTPGAVLTPTRECRGRTAYSGQAGEPGGTYIRAAPTFPQGWGPGCNLLDEGDACTTRWNGAYTILSDTKGYIEFQAWTDSGREPFRRQQVPVADHGQFRRWEFPMRVPQAKEVAIRLVLMDSRKVALAISDAFIYPVGCGRESR